MTTHVIEVTPDHYQIVEVGTLVDMGDPIPHGTDNQLLVSVGGAWQALDVSGDVLVNAGTFTVTALADYLLTADFGATAQSWWQAAPTLSEALAADDVLVVMNTSDSHARTALALSTLSAYMQDSLSAAFDDFGSVLTSTLATTPVTMPAGAFGAGAIYFGGTRAYLYRATVPSWHGVAVQEALIIGNIGLEASPTLVFSGAFPYNSAGLYGISGGGIGISAYNGQGAFQVHPGGKIGINQNSPQARLHVVESGALTTTPQLISIWEAQTTAAAQSGFGQRTTFRLENGAGITGKDAAALDVVWSNSAGGTEYGLLKLMAGSAGTLAPIMQAGYDAAGAVVQSFYGLSTPVPKPTITGSRAGNAALASLLTALAAMGLVTDSSVA